MPLVELSHVTRRYGSTLALNDVSFTLEPGIIGLVGNNGAGKSTLLKVLLGLIPPDAGTIRVLDADPSRQSLELRGQVGYMSEAHATVPLLRGAEFVTLSGDLYGMPHGDARRRAHEVLNYVGLGELRYRRLEEYSTGNLQRLKLAAALVHDPRLLLLDEPTNGLDPAGRAAMLELLTDLIRETGKSVILCTHLLSDVERLCDQIVVLHRGQAIHAGPMRSLGHATQHRYVLGWRGDCQGLVAGLQEAGAEVTVIADRTARHGNAETPGGVTELVTANRLTAAVPADWHTARFFQIAQARGAVIDYLSAEAETLEQLFLRVTGTADGPVSVT
ncbi:MAG: ABC transporter ATP-binding protein [Planctomycetes bacterium]|nr:ABC transporter ATP-binding protein [Planctomycetota bacterium]